MEMSKANTVAKPVKGGVKAPIVTSKAAHKAGEHVKSKKGIKVFREWWFWLIIVIAVLGGVAGFLVYWFAGHKPGVCATGKFYGGAGLGCVDCTSASECPSGICSKNKCLECVINADCQLAQFNGSTGYLHNATCNADGSCTRPCTSNAQCLELKNLNKVCDQGICSQCATGADCPASSGYSNPQCNTATRKCLKCGAASPCDAKYKCVDERCFKGCSPPPATDCPGNEICEQGICIVCDLKKSTGGVSLGCSATKPFCIEDPSGNNVECVQCRTTSDCGGSTGMVCGSDHSCIYPAAPATGLTLVSNNGAGGGSVYNYDPANAFTPQSTIPTYAGTTLSLVFFPSASTTAFCTAGAIPFGVLTQPWGGPNYFPSGMMFWRDSVANPIPLRSSILRSPVLNGDGHFTYALYFTATPSQTAYQLGSPCDTDVLCDGKPPPPNTDPQYACNGGPCNDPAKACGSAVTTRWTDGYFSQSAMACPGKVALPAEEPPRHMALFVSAGLTGQKVPTVFNLLALDKTTHAPVSTGADKDSVVYIATGDNKWLLSLRYVGLPPDCSTGFDMWSDIQQNPGTVEWIANEEANFKYASLWTFGVAFS